MEVESATSLLSSLETPLITISSISEQLTINSFPFLLVLSPRASPVNFIQLQEYFISHNAKILSATSQFGAVMFKDFDIKSAEEWASILSKSGMKEMPYIGGAAIRRLIVASSCHDKRIPSQSTHSLSP